MNAARLNASPGRRSGFTLLELLIALSISSILLVVLSGLLSVSLTQWNRQTGRHLANSEAQWALATLVEDIQSIVRKNGESEWLQVKSVNVEGLGNTPQLLFLARPADADTIAARNDEQSEGSVCAISYRLQKRDPFDADEPIHALYRATKSPEQTAEHLGADDLFATFWGGSSATRTDDLIASNVARFDLAFRVQRPDGTEEMIREAYGLRCAETVEFGASQTTPLPEGSQILALTIELTTIDQAAQALLNDGTLPLEEILTRHGRIFSTTIDFPSPTLP